MKKSYEPVPKMKAKTKKPLRGQARPDEPLADRCELHVIGVCTGPAENRHHRVLRSQGGTDDATNTLDVCFACHGYIHANRRLAYARGWIRRPDRKVS